MENKTAILLIFKNTHIYTHSSINIDIFYLTYFKYAVSFRGE
jgi:hypothetical protein